MIADLDTDFGDVVAGEEGLVGWLRTCFFLFFIFFGLMGRAEGCGCLLGE
jgi:hypothetical protein